MLQLNSDPVMVELNSVEISVEPGVLMRATNEEASGSVLVPLITPVCVATQLLIPPAAPHGLPENVTSGVSVGTVICACAADEIVTADSATAASKASSRIGPPLPAAGVPYLSPVQSPLLHPARVADG